MTKVGWVTDYETQTISGKTGLGGENWVAGVLTRLDPGGGNEKSGYEMEVVVLWVDTDLGGSLV